MNASQNLATRLNRECGCRVMDLPALRRRIDAAIESAGTAGTLLDTHPHLFSDVPVFLDPAHVEEMRGVVAAVERIVHSSGYQQLTLDAAPAIARLPRAAGSAFLGFDFHVGDEGPRLIEINTNAGGAFANLAALDARSACCEPAEGFLSAGPAARQLEAAIVAMLRREWQLERTGGGPHTIAIVDENPAGQYLFPEFALARQLFERHGIETVIADPEQLQLDENGVHFEGRRVDLIYNRLTDFYLQDPRNCVIRDAWERNLAVVTPNPRAYALYADKRNLALLSNGHALADIGVDAPTRELLARAIPLTRTVDGSADAWWDDRKQWFFKPWRGFGSRGTYRGDKLTRRVFGEIVAGEYVAQRLAPPGERLLSGGDGIRTFKVDVRCYAYAGTVQLMAARLYQGQTTNFRTAGGGFAPVYPIENLDLENLQAAGCI